MSVNCRHQKYYLMSLPGRAVPNKHYKLILENVEGFLKRDGIKRSHYKDLV